MKTKIVSFLKFVVKTFLLFCLIMTVLLANKAWNSYRDLATEYQKLEVSHQVLQEDFKKYRQLAKEANNLSDMKALKCEADLKVLKALTKKELSP